MLLFNQMLKLQSFSSKISNLKLFKKDYSILLKTTLKEAIPKHFCLLPFLDIKQY